MNVGYTSAVSCWVVLNCLFVGAHAFVNVGLARCAISPCHEVRALSTVREHICDHALFSSRAQRRSVIASAGKDGHGLWAWKEATAAAMAVLQIIWTGTGTPSAPRTFQPCAPVQRVSADRISLAQTPVVKDATAGIRPAHASGPFEEAWEAVNSFYLDKTYKGNDWQAVRARLRADIFSGEKTENKATEEMLALLGDEYSRWIDPTTYTLLSEYDLVGVGIMMSTNSAGQLTVISPPRVKSQAESLGVKKGDLILSINGRDTTKTKAADMINYLSMYQGETLTFEFKGPERGEVIRKVELERTFPTVEAPVVYAVKDQGEHKVGYARLRSFNFMSPSALKSALVEMKEQGADEFVLDLRGNGGGSFQSAVEIAGLFMEKQPVTYLVDSTGKRAEFTAQTGAVLPNEPLVVWIDKFSASASEVLAGALQDDCRAILRGSTTFGKGLVQAVYGLSDGSGLTLTVAQYETPRGSYVHDKGIVPDIRGGLPFKLLSTMFNFDQDQFDAARERMKSCTPLKGSRVGFTGAAGVSTPTNV